MNAATVLSTTYLGTVEYYSKLFHYKTVIEQFEYYSKQLYCNRCHIASSDGVMVLTIPILNEQGKKLVRDVRISTHSAWQRIHWKAIMSAYRNSPFFEYFADDLVFFFEKKWTFLLDFNLEIQQKMLELLDIEAFVSLSNSYQPASAYQEDMRGKINPRSSLQNNFVVNSYYQIFSMKTGFLPNLSIIDLLFNMGNESRLVLKKSEKLN